MTIKDIARESGYAIGTVSRVLNNQENVSPKAYSAIMEVVDKHNFQINVAAKNLKTQVSKSIIVLVKGNENRLFSGMVEKIQTKLTSAGYSVAVDIFDENENEVLRAISAVREQKPMGLMFLGGINEHFRKSFSQITLPSVIVTNHAEKLGFENLSSVSIDDIKSSKDGVDFLFANGHKNIGVIGGDLSLSEVSQMRMQGVLESFKENGEAFDLEKQFQIARFSLSSGYASVAKLIEKFPDITAIFAMSDVMAIGAQKAIFDMGKKVPEDISIMGFDGLDITEYCYPSISTVEQSMDDMARCSAEIILEKIAFENSPAKHVISNHKILARNSVKKIKDNIK